MTEATQLIQPSPENEMYRPFTVFQPRQLLDVDSEEKDINNLRRQTPSLQTPICGHECIASRCGYIPTHLINVRRSDYVTLSYIHIHSLVLRSPTTKKNALF